MARPGRSRHRDEIVAGCDDQSTSRAKVPALGVSVEREDSLHVARRMILPNDLVFAGSVVL